MKKNKISNIIFRIASELKQDIYSMFEKMPSFLKEKNKSYSKYIKYVRFFQKGDVCFVLVKFVDDLYLLDQIVMQFDIQDVSRISYNANIYCKEDIYDQKLYYTIQHVFNKSTKTFDGTTKTFQKQLYGYVDYLFKKYFKIENRTYDVSSVQF